MRRLPAYLYVADLVPGKRVLEVGSGDGDGAAFLASCGAARVVGVDGAREQLDRARRRHRLANLELRCEDVGRLELDDGSIDMVFVTDAARLIRRLDALEELRRVLAPGGWLIACARPALGRAAPGGVSFHELSERLQPLFAPVRMAAESPFVGVSLCEYADGDAASPAVSLDRTLVDPRHEAEVTGYVAICGGPSEAPRGFTLVEIPAERLPVVVEEAEELRRELDRVKANWHQAEAKNDEVWRRVGEVQTELEALREQTMESSRKQRQQAQVDMARALEKGALEVLGLQEKLGREQARSAELERSLEEAETARAALELQAIEGEGAIPVGVRRGVERLERELAEARAVVDELAAAVGDLGRAAAAGGGPDRSLALELGVREAELTFLTIGLSSLQAKVREAVGRVRDAQRSMQGRSAEDMLALMNRLEESLRGLA